MEVSAKLMNSSDHEWVLGRDLGKIRRGREMKNQRNNRKRQKLTFENDGCFEDNGPEPVCFGTVGFQTIVI